MWHSGTWFSGGLGSVRLTVGLNDLKGLFQPKRFCDSKYRKLGILFNNCLKEIKSRVLSCRDIVYGACGFFIVMEIPFSAVSYTVSPGS